MLTNTFADELGGSVGQASTNMLLHVLDDALGGGSGVPPSRDYLNGVDANAAMSAAFDRTLAELAATLGPDPYAWQPSRGTTAFVHPILGTVGSIPTSNRATYAQIVVLERPRSRGESIFTLGQSGFAQLVPTGGFRLDAHFRDQLDLYRRFEYKPQHLYLNSQLQE